MAQQGKELTEDQVSDIVQKLKVGFAKGYTVRQASLYAGISYQTYYNYFGKNDELLNEFDLLRQSPILLAKDNIHEALSSGDVRVSQWYLESQDSGFKRESKTKIVTDDGDGGDASICQVIDYSKISESAARELLEAMSTNEEKDK